MTQLVYNRFRLKKPLKRVGGEKGAADSKFEPISWDEALEIIAKKFLELRDAGEARAIANKTSGRLLRGTGSLVGRFFSLLGSPNDTDVGPVCNDAGGNALGATFGMGNFTNGYGVDEATGKQDLGSAKFFLFLGTNQAETHPVTFAYLLRERAKTKAKLVVIDPRLTPTGAQADDWIAPKPHTDLALVLAMLHHVLTKELYDKAFVAKWVLGFKELDAHVRDKSYTPEWAEGVTGVPAAKIRQVAEMYAAAKPAAIFCNAGISHQLNAFDTYRALAFLAAITGNVGVNGGGCNFMHNTWPGGLNLPPVKEALPKKDVGLPVGPDYFAESILTGKPYALKALVTEGNPVLGCANTAKVKEAFKKLPFYVYTGLFMEEPAYYADVILPVCSGFEMEGVYMRRDDRSIRWQKQVVPRVGESKTDPEIWIDLGHAMAKLDKKNPPEYWTEEPADRVEGLQATLGRLRRQHAGHGRHDAGTHGEARRAVALAVPDDEAPRRQHALSGSSVVVRGSRGPRPGQQGQAFPDAAAARSRFTRPTSTKSWPPRDTAALPIFYTHPEVTGKNPTIEYTADLVNNPVNPGTLTPNVKLGGLSTGAVHEEFPLMGMIGRPSVVHFAGVTQWTYTGKQLNGVRLIQIHPKAMKLYGIENGDTIVVESPRGSITGTALLWIGIREDTIFVPNTFGPMQKMAEELGTPLYEPANLLIDDRYFDNLSGQQAYKCFACRVRKS